MPKLEDICSITAGQIMPRVEAGNASEVVCSVKLITPRAIENGILQVSELSDVDLKKTPDTSKLVHKGDIVLKLSTPYSAALVTEEIEGLMASSFCTIIRCTDPSYDNRFLVSYLNTRYAREQLRRSTVGITVPTLKISDLKSLIIPVIDTTKCKEAVRALELNQQKKEVLKQMLETCEAYDESIVFTAIGDFEA